MCGMHTQQDKKNLETVEHWSRDVMAKFKYELNVCMGLEQIYFCFPYEYVYVFLSHTIPAFLRQNTAKLATMEPVGGDLHLSYDFSLTALNLFTPSIPFC